MLLLIRLAKYTLILTTLIIIALFSLYLNMRSELPSVDSLKDMQWQTPMQIYSADNKLISQFGSKKRIPLTIDNIPQQLIDALLATEDDRFYLHFGVDPIGMGRAVIGQLTGNPKGGASTITMQVARNFFLSREVTYTRKIREIFISFHIESLLSKDEILELYMNKIELGHRSFGFGAAAQVYYGKEISELTLAQMAVLAGLPKAPSNLNPIRSPEKAKARRAIVLKRMLVSGYISKAEYELANNAPITGKRHGTNIELDAPYIAEMVHQEMVDIYGKEAAYTNGYKVFTTVPSKLQLAAKQAIIDNLISYDQRHGYRGAVLSLRKTKADNDTINANKLDASIPLTSKEIEKTFKDIKPYQILEPAIVNVIHEDAASIILANKETAAIKWQHMSWARLYINDQKQGPAPKNVSQVLNIGDVIYVIKNNEGDYILSQLPDVSAALVALSPDNGAIQAMVGGFSFKQSQFNRATQAKRQVGSNIKPFIYSAALENGFTLGSLVNDAAINKWDRSTGSAWRPKNSPEVYSGPLRVRLALAQSKNVVAIRLLREVGIPAIIDHLSHFGFNPNELPSNESLALGSASLTPLEVATGFATFANGGFLIEPYLIERVEDSFGNVLYQANPAIACNNCLKTNEEDSLSLDELIDSEISNSDEAAAMAGDTIAQKITSQPEIEVKLAPRVISSQNAFLITQALNSAIWGADWSVTPGWQGTGYRARSLKRQDIAGKTGTTNESKDAWFSGYSRHLIATSWIGFDDHRKNLGKTTRNTNLGKNQITGGEFGAKSAQPAWISFMDTALTDYPEESFQQPQDVVTARIDKKTGKLTTKTDKSSTFEYFISGTVPTEYVSRDYSNEIFDNEGDTSTEESIF